MSSFLLIVYPILPNVSLKKSSLHEYQLLSASYMPFTNPIICQKGFVTPYELFFPNNMPCVCHTLYHILYLCYLNMSSFLQLHTIYWPHSLSKNFVTTYELLPANFMLVTDPIRCQKDFVIPYELFSANCMPFTGQGLYHKPFLAIWALFC